MGATPTGPALKVELPDITRADIARFTGKAGAGVWRRPTSSSTPSAAELSACCAPAALPGHSPEQPCQSAA